MSATPYRIISLSAALVATLALAACAASSRTATKPIESREVSYSTAVSIERRESEINIPVTGKITRTGEIYLLRGLANVFSRGIDALGAKMVRRGLDARVFNHAAWRELADNIVLRSKSKQVSYPIIIMGHSLGANAAANMAKYLGERGVKVAYVVAFDPTVPTTVGKNVGRVINLYLPNDDHNNLIKPAAGFKGTIKNRNITGVRGLTHTTVEKDGKFHADVIERTLGYTRKTKKRASS